jgi:hypothetical protein
MKKYAQIQAEFELHQNYPNPFNPETTISYVIPSGLPVGKAGVRNLNDFSSTSSPRNDNVNVTLKVYDILGKEVTTLVNEAQQPGRYNVKFTIRQLTDNGDKNSSLSTGIYFYKLQASDFVQTQKMMLTK